MKKNRIIAFMTAFILLITLGNQSAAANTAKENVKYVYPGGEPFGVRFYNDGVMITKLEEFFDGEKYICPAKEASMKVGDIIRKINNIEISSNDDVKNLLAENGEEEIKVSLTRENRQLDTTVKPGANTAGIYLLGAWIRDSCAGIGTITYYDPDKNYFAALGHGICDIDTGKLMPLKSAEIVGAEIGSVSKSVDGRTGSLNGFFTDNKMGIMSKNTPVGIYGTIFDNFAENKAPLKIADFDEIKTGKAEILTTIDGRSPRGFDAKIIRFCNNDPQSNENFVIKITDEELLQKSGGIVQGMSGSPIIQDEKLVGAITHVFVNNTDEGYGISAQFMVSNYEK